MRMRPSVQSTRANSAEFPAGLIANGNGAFEVFHALLATAERLLGKSAGDENLRKVEVVLGIASMMETARSITRRASSLSPRERSDSLRFIARVSDEEVARGNRLFQDLERRATSAITSSYRRSAKSAIDLLTRAMPKRGVAGRRSWQ